jgi:uncharacterized membrane protein
VAVRAALKRTRAQAHAAPARLAAIDALRGLAIVAMVAFHFSFDLALFRLARFDFEHDLGWIVARDAIVASFMGLVGVSLVLAARQDVPASRRWRRVAVIAACALAVSAASYALFPRTWIRFGILHAIALASVIAWPLVRRPRLALALGVAIVAAGALVAHPAFDAPGLQWIGFTTTPPPTEDYVPLFPWLGVTLIGIAAGDALARRGFAALGPLARAPGALRWLGRHSLAVYMVHQPIMIGALALALGRLP